LAKGTLTRRRNPALQALGSAILEIRLVSRKAGLSCLNAGKQIEHIPGPIKGQGGAQMRTRFIALFLVAATLLAACGAPAEATLSPAQSTLISLQEESNANLEVIATQIADLRATVTAMSEIEEPAPTSKPEEPVAPAVAGSDFANVDSANDNPTITMDWGSANVPASVVTIKANTTGGCTMPDVVCYMLDDEGVLGADELAEAEANPSAIWTGSAWHQMAQGPEVGLLVPEGSYATWYSISSTVDGGGYHLEFTPVGEQQCSGVLVRGWFAKTHADRHVPIVVSNYGATGAMIYTRYPVPVEAGQFFSQGYLTDQAKSALDFDNTGIGDEDCDTFWQFVFDYNDGSLSVLKYTTEAGWQLDWTNVVGHGR
jgi:hypothetical protein